MSEDLLDLDEFKERVQDDNELLLELLDIFMADYEVKRQALQGAVEGNNFEEIKSVAHSLKGASGNISAKSMREIFLQIEEIGKAGDISGASEKLTQLDGIYTSLKTRIEEIKQELS